MVECNLCGEAAGRWQIIDPDGAKTYVCVCVRHSVDLRFLVDHGTPAKHGPFGVAAMPVKKPTTARRTRKSPDPRLDT